MVKNARAWWSFLPFVDASGLVNIDLFGASVVFSVSEAATNTLIEGQSVLTLFGTEVGQPYAGPFVLPTVYDSQRRVIPYRQKLHCNFIDKLKGCVQCLNLEPAMYSDTHHCEVRFLTLDSLGTTEPVDLVVEGAAVLLRISNYNPGAANIDGMNIFQTLRTGPVFDVRQDWPPVYDADWRIVPYRHTFRFSAPGGQPIVGAFTCVDVVPNR